MAFVYDTVLQDGSTTTGNGTAADLRGADNATFYLSTTDTKVTAGAVTYETTDVAPDYGGTWASLASAVTITTTKTSQITVVTGKPLRWVRARISTNVTGAGSSGTWTARVVANRS